MTIIGPFNLGLWWGIPVLLGEQKTEAIFLGMEDGGCTLLPEERPHSGVKGPVSPQAALSPHLNGSVPRAC